MSAPSFRPNLCHGHSSWQCGQSIVGSDQIRNINSSIKERNYRHNESTTANFQICHYSVEMPCNAIFILLKHPIIAKIILCISECESWLSFIPLLYCIHRTFSVFLFHLYYSCKVFSKSWFILLIRNCMCWPAVHKECKNWRKGNLKPIKDHDI